MTPRRAPVFALYRAQPGGSGDTGRQKPRDDWLGLAPLAGGSGGGGRGVLSGAGSNGQGQGEAGTNGTAANSKKSGAVSAGVKVGPAAPASASLLDWAADDTSSGAAGGLLSGGGNGGGGGGGGGGGASRNQMLQQKVRGMVGMVNSTCERSDLLVPVL